MIDCCLAAVSESMASCNPWRCPGFHGPSRSAFWSPVACCKGMAEPWSAQSRSMMDWYWFSCAVAWWSGLMLWT